MNTLPEPLCAVELNGPPDVEVGLNALDSEDFGADPNRFPGFELPPAPPPNKFAEALAGGGPAGVVELLLFEPKSFVVGGVLAV